MDKPDVGDELTIFICDEEENDTLKGRIEDRCYCTARGCVAEVRKSANCTQVDFKVIDVGAEGE